MLFAFLLSCLSVGATVTQQIQTLKATLTLEYTTETETNMDCLEAWEQRLDRDQAKLAAIKVTAKNAAQLQEIKDNITDCRNYLGVYKLSINKVIASLSTALNMVAAARTQEDVNKINNYYAANLDKQIAAQFLIEGEILALIKSIEDDLVGQ